jgi:hypothetical protein
LLLSRFFVVVAVVVAVAGVVFRVVVRVAVLLMPVLLVAAAVAVDGVQHNILPTAHAGNRKLASTNRWPTSS